MNTSLFEMSKEASALYELLMSCDEMDEETREKALKDTIEAIGADEKLQSYGAIIKKLESNRAAAKAEKERCAKIEKYFDSAINRMKFSVIGFMDSIGKKKMNAGIFRYVIRESEETVIDDEMLIPKKYMNKKIEYKPDKAAIKTVLQSGKKVKGAHLKPNRSVTVK